MVNSAASHGARFLWGNTLYLKPGTKEHFMEFVGREFPDREVELKWLYPGSYAPKWAESDVKERVAGLKGVYGLGERETDADAPAPPRQLELALK